MFCASCGKQVAEGTSFCPNCGARLSAPTPPTATYTPPETAPTPTYTPPTAVPLPPTSAAAPPKSKKKMWIAVVAVALVASAVMGYFISSGRNDKKESGKTGTNAAERVNGKVDARGDEKNDGNRGADSDAPSVRSVAGTYVGNVDAMALYANVADISTTASLYAKCTIRLDGNGRAAVSVEVDEEALYQASIQAAAEEAGVSFEEMEQMFIEKLGSEYNASQYFHVMYIEPLTKKVPKLFGEEAYYSYTVKGDRLEIPDDEGETVYFEIVGDTLRLYSEEYDIAYVLVRQ